MTVTPKPDLIVIVPARDRPDAMVELADNFRETCTQGTHLVFALDDDSPTVDQYEQCRPSNVELFVSGSRTMVQALNHAAFHYRDDAFAIGFMGDDHRPRTAGWDYYYCDALRDLGTGIVYGDDLLQGARIPTQCAMTADIVRMLGYMAPPALTHLFVDNFWRDLGTAAGCLAYLPNVVVEHMHPVAGKADWDEGHVRVNQRSMYARDEQAYRRYLTESMAAAVGGLQALRGAR